MSKFLRSYGILLILLVALGMRLGLATTSLDLEIRADEREYTDIARDMAPDPLGYPGVFRPPLYPFLLVFSNAAFGETRFAAGVMQALLATLNVVVIYAMAQTLFRRKAASLLAALLFAVSLELVAIARLYYSETLFFLLLSAGFWLLFKWVRSPNPQLLVIPGIIFGLTALTRDVVTGFALVIVPFWFAVVLAPRWRRLGTALACFGIGLGIVLVPWVIRNASIEHRLVLVGTSGEYVFARDNARLEEDVGITPNLEGAVLGRDKGRVVINYQRTILRDFRNTPPEERGNFARERGMVVIRHAPVQWFFLKVSDLTTFFQPVTHQLPYLRLQTLPAGWGAALEVIVAVLFVSVFFAAVIGMWLAPDNAPKLLILLFVLLNLVTFIVTHYQPRYRLPLTILLFPYAAYGVVRLMDWLALRFGASAKSRVSQAQPS
jgi:4-amino-4-deoxy-L-arabinose transferase-like glycosyltransferase